MATLGEYEARPVGVLRHIGIILPTLVTLYVWLASRPIPFAGPTMLGTLTALLRTYGGPRRPDRGLSDDLYAALFITIVPLRLFVAPATWTYALTTAGWVVLAFAIEFVRSALAEPDPGAK